MLLLLTPVHTVLVLLAYAASQTLASAAEPAETYVVNDLVNKLGERARGTKTVTHYRDFLGKVAGVVASRLPQASTDQWLASAKASLAANLENPDLKAKAHADLARLVALLKEEDTLVGTIDGELKEKDISAFRAREILDEARHSEISAFLVASAKIKQLEEKLGVKKELSAFVAAKAPRDAEAAAAAPQETREWKNEDGVWFLGNVCLEWHTRELKNRMASSSRSDQMLNEIRANRDFDELKRLIGKVNTRLVTMSPEQLLNSIEECVNFGHEFKETAKIVRGFKELSNLGAFLQSIRTEIRKELSSLGMVKAFGQSPVEQQLVKAKLKNLAKASPGNKERIDSVYRELDELHVLIEKIRPTASSLEKTSSDILFIWGTAKSVEDIRDFVNHAIKATQNQLDFFMNHHGSVLPEELKTLADSVNDNIAELKAWLDREVKLGDICLEVHADPRNFRSSPASADVFGIAMHWEPLNSLRKEAEKLANAVLSKSHLREHCATWPENYHSPHPKYVHGVSVSLNALKLREDFEKLAGEVAELEIFFQGELEFVKKASPAARERAAIYHNLQVQARKPELDSLRAKLQNLTLNPTDPAVAAVAEVLNKASAAVTKIEATAKSSNLRPARIAGTKPK